MNTTWPAPGSMRAALLVLLLLGAGCVAPAAAPLDTTAAGSEDTIITWEGRRLAGEDDGLTQNVATTKCLAGACEIPEPACGRANCERVPFDVPATAEPRDLVVRLRWPNDWELWFTLAIEDASGALVARGRSIVIDHDGSAARIARIEPGSYVAIVILISGQSDYQLDARLEPPAPATGELLPDLVTLRPTDLRIEQPPATQVGPFSLLPGEVGAVASGAMGAKGCSPEEAAAGARRCLRFSNLVGNAGTGPLDIRLSLEAGATSPAGGAFRQVIHSADGSSRDVAAGAAEFHAIHAHWHNAAANAFTIYDYDVATASRGEPHAEGRKTGICFADVGLMWEGAPHTQPAAFQGSSCVNPVIERDWRMGIEPGWYDEYPWQLSDQFVDIAGLADGDYLLCANTNAVGTLVESDPTNDEACTPFHLAGDDVTELTPAPYYASYE